MISKLDTNIPKLGFGLMRLPKINDVIDIEQLKQMVDVYLEKDLPILTPPGDMRNLKSIKQLRWTGIPERPVSFATLKCPHGWPIRNRKQKKCFGLHCAGPALRTLTFICSTILAVQIISEQTPSINMIYGILQLNRRSAGRIKHLGCSVHASAEHLDEILTTHPELNLSSFRLITAIGIILQYNPGNVMRSQENTISP